MENTINEMKVPFLPFVMRRFCHALFSLAPEYPGVKLWSPYGQRRVCSTETKPVINCKLSLRNHTVCSQLNFDIWCNTYMCRDFAFERHIKIFFNDLCIVYGLNSKLILFVIVEKLLVRQNNESLIFLLFYD